MTLREIEWLLRVVRLRLDQVSGGTLLGRISEGEGPFEELTPASARIILGLPQEVAYNAISDTDTDPLYDIDGRALYEPGDVIDNPIAATRFFDTVGDMLDVDGWTVDRAITRNYDAGDGLRQEWVMQADPSLAENTENIRQTNDGYGFMTRVAQIT